MNTRSFDDVIGPAGPVGISEAEPQIRGETVAEEKGFEWREKIGGCGWRAKHGAVRRGERFGEEARKALILVPTDLSEDSFEAVRVGVSIARKSGGRVLLFHAVHLNLSQYGPANPARLKAALCQEAMAKAEPLLRFAQAEGVRALCAVEEGVQATAILKGAKKWQADIIVLASKPRGWLARIFRRRTVERVISEAACPVMVLQQNSRKS